MTDQTKVVLIVDDEEILRRATKRILRDSGAQFQEASNGAEALELLKAGLRPALILTDCDMPKMTGLELVEELQKDPQLATITVIVGSGDEGNGILARRLGCMFYQKGSTEPSVLREMVRKNLL